jgi:Mg-chelatase subunit ChlD
VTTAVSTDPRAVLDRLADSVAPYLIGVRHHSPAVAAVVPALLDAAAPDLVCVELPTDFQRWLPYLADPATRAPVALAGTHDDGRLGFYPFADFSPELAAIRWARDHGVEVVCCDLPLADPGWSGADPVVPGPADDSTPAGEPATARGGTDGTPDTPVSRPGFAAALAAGGTGRDGDDLWDRAVEVRAPGCPPEAVRRAALAVGWAMRQDAVAGAGVPARDLAREAHMRRIVARGVAAGRRVAAVVGAFHAAALTDLSDALPEPSDAAASEPVRAPGDPSGAVRRAGDTADARHDVAASGGVATSLVPYAFDLLDSRSGYAAGIRDPRWQQAVFLAGGDPERIREAAARTITELCRALRAAGHTAGTGEAGETLRVAEDLARLRALPAPGRGELLEAVTTVLGQGEPLGRGRALARALESVMVGTDRGRVAPGTPRSGLGPAVEAELAALRLPNPDDPAPRELRLDPLRSELDGRREILLRRLLICGIDYGQPIEVSGVGDGTALSTRWQVSWKPAVAAMLDLAGVRGVTAALAAAGTLRDRFRREAADGGPTCAQLLAGLTDAARCDLPDLVAERLDLAATVLPAAGTLAELVAALDLLEAMRRQHLPGTTAAIQERAGGLAVVLLDAALRGLPGLAGSDDLADAAALVALAVRAGEHRTGLLLDEALDRLCRTGSPLIQGAALAARVLLDLDPPDVLGARAAGWVDAGTDADGRRRLHRLLRGLLSAAGPLLQSTPAALDPLLDRIEHLTDQDFLDRLPALRGGFDILSPAARDRLLQTITDRLGDRLDLALSAPPDLLARWAAADAAGGAALSALRLPVPLPGIPAGQPGSDAPDLRSGAADPATLPSGPGGAAALRSGTADTPDLRSGPGDATPEARTVVATADPALPAPTAAVGLHHAVSAPAGRRFSPADRWRLLLGRQPERLPAELRRHAHALDELYGTGRGEGAAEIGRGGGSGGGQESPFPTAREWADELTALFGPGVREEVLAQAAETGRADVLAELDPAAVRPSVALLTSVLSLAGGLPEAQLARLRPLVRRLVDELARQLATRLQPALTGLSTPRPTRRPGGRLNLDRTLRANLAHTRRLDDGRLVVIPERPVFHTLVRREADWRLVLVVDVSGSMEASVVWSALTAAVLAGVPTLSTHFLAFSTEVIDLTERVSDPLSLLLEVRVGGGTHIAAGLAHARSLVTVPSRTLVVVVSDFEEGYPLAGLLGEVRALATSGVHLLGCAALDDKGVPRYSVPIAQQLVAAGMPVAALSPLELARWVGDRLRGGSR